MNTGVARLGGRRTPAATQTVAAVSTTSNLTPRSWFLLFERGAAIGLADYLVAATADLHGLPLATLNVKHFPMFDDLRAPFPFLGDDVEFPR